MKKTILVTLILALLVISACTQAPKNNEELLILTTAFPLYEFASQIAPSENVRMLVPPGVDVHHYDLKPSDIVLLEQADLIIFIGEEMEPWLEKILNLEHEAGRTLQATRKVKLLKAEHHHHHDNEQGHNHDHDEAHEHDDELEHLLEKLDHIIHEWEDGDISAEEAMEEIEELIHDFEHIHDYHQDHDHGHSHDSEYDPHVWLDFENSIEIVNAITSRLTQLKTEDSAEFRRNADEYVAKLRALDNKYASELENCEIRSFIVNHDSFGYLANKYELEQIPIRGLSAEQEPSPRTIANIIEEAREHNIKHVFFEELASPRVSDAIAKEIGAQTLMLSPGENIPAKDWGKKTFIELMQENLENLKTGLRCE